MPGWPVGSLCLQKLTRQEIQIILIMIIIEKAGSTNDNNTIVAIETQHWRLIGSTLSSVLTKQDVLLDL